MSGVSKEEMEQWGIESKQFLLELNDRQNEIYGDVNEKKFEAFNKTLAVSQAAQFSFFFLLHCQILKQRHQFF